ncbi:MAG: RNase adapter RapZ [Synergistaceae bacterium]|jgi:UPF0042 nucleotide-binding protein|nr:RNase adapter RapZ [Synergistaceae bacterium]
MMTPGGRVERCVIVSGMSGAGKTTVLKILEDQGFFAVDNIPPIMMPALMSALARCGPAVEVGVAVVADLRGRELFDGLAESVCVLKRDVASVRTVFLDAGDESLVRRFETTRRRHPLGGAVTILESIAEERLRLAGLRAAADIIIDTTRLLPGDLRSIILSELGEGESPISVVVSSFGFKNGIPSDCDYLFDVRFLPNPNYVPELKKLSGRDAAVREYMERDERKKSLVERIESFMELVLSGYENTPKKHIHIAIGCTGGRHRSVAVAEELASHLSLRGHAVRASHRDIDLEAG